MTIYFAADHHFQHKNIIGFSRPQFNSIDQHDEYIVKNHNDTVNDPANDVVYFLGDVTWKFNGRAKELLQSMNGTKYLIGGNHDDLDWLMDTGLFKAHYTWKYFPEHNLIASHFPIHNDDFQRAKYNIHGHIHDKVMKTTSGNMDYRYLNVSMEKIDYCPVSLEDAIDNLKLHIR